MRKELNLLLEIGPLGRLLGIAYHALISTVQADRFRYLLIRCGKELRRRGDYIDI
jgi:hypothetical protein